jgi:hypothetical protein
MKRLSKFQLKSIFSILTLTLLVSCTTSRSTTNLDRAYQATGMNQYFLADLPKWANFSESTACYRKEPIRYLDFGALMKSFSLNYHQASQIQAYFNQSYLNVVQSPQMKMTLTDEDRMFNESLQKVQNKIPFFEAPTFHTIHLIHFDDYYQTKNTLSQLLEFLKSSVNDSGVPILVSSCLSTLEVQKLLQDVSFKIIGAEFFSPFTKEGVLKPLMSLDLDAFFEPKQKLLFFTKQKNMAIKHLEGKFKVVQY